MEHTLNGFQWVALALVVVVGGYATLLSMPVCAVAADTSASCADWNTGRFFTTASVEDVTACLKAGADPRARGQFGTTPLHWAALTNNNPDVIAALVRAGADPNARNDDGRTPLHTAASINAMPEVIAELVKMGADPKVGDNHGWTLLHAAVMSPFANLDTIAALLKGGADLNAPDERSETPLHRAAQSSKPSADFAAIPPPEDSDELFDPSAMAEMFKAGADSILDIIAVLVQAGGDPNAPNEDGRTPLHQAARHTANLDTIAALLKGDADPNAPDEKGQTPLHVAAWFTTNPEIIAALLEAGGDPKARDQNGSKPGDFAERNGRLKDTDVYRQLKEGQ